MTSAQASIPIGLVSATTEAVVGFVGLAPAAGAGVSANVLALAESAGTIAKWTAVVDSSNFERI